MAPQNIPHAILLTLGNKVVLTLGNKVVLTLGNKVLLTLRNTVVLTHGNKVISLVSNWNLSNIVPDAQITSERSSVVYSVRVKRQYLYNDRD